MLPESMPINSMRDKTQLDRIEAQVTENYALLVKLLEKKTPKSRKSKKHEYTDKFEMTWFDYPKVSGANKTKAYAAYLKRMSESLSTLKLAATIHSAVKKYAAFCKETDRFVMLPATFFGPDRHYLNDWTIPTTAESVPKTNEDLPSWAQDKGFRGPLIGESWVNYRKALEILYRVDP